MNEIYTDRPRILSTCSWYFIREIDSDHRKPGVTWNINMCFILCLFQYCYVGTKRVFVKKKYNLLTYLRRTVR